MTEDIESKRQRCSVYSRIVGYVRRVEAYNPGKQAEFKDRKLFSTELKIDKDKMG